MNTIALIFMIVTEVIIVSLTIYFFYKVLRSKPRSEPDSHSENDFL